MGDSAAVHIMSDDAKMTVTSGAMCVMAASREKRLIERPSITFNPKEIIASLKSYRLTDFRSSLNKNGRRRMVFPPGGS